MLDTVVDTVARMVKKTVILPPLIELAVCVCVRARARARACKCPLQIYIYIIYIYIYIYKITAVILTTKKKGALKAYKWSLRNWRGDQRKLL